MKRRNPISRKAPFKKTWGALKRTRLRPRSKKRERDDRLYSAKRKAFLAAHPYCQAWLTEHVLPLDFTMEQAEQLARNGMLDCPPSTDIHHVKRRGRYYLDESTWLAVARSSHRKIHDNPRWARELGLLA